MIIVIFGLPATGKTYLSEHLVKELDAVHLNTDITREKPGKECVYDEKSEPGSETLKQIKRNPELMKHCSKGF